MASKQHIKHDDDERPIDWSKAKIIRRGPKRGVRMSLQSLRVAAGKTQVELAAKADIAQSEVSRVESRDDALVSTLRRYIEALGGKLEIVAAFEKTGHRITIDLDDGARDTR